MTEHKSKKELTRRKFNKSLAVIVGVILVAVTMVNFLLYKKNNSSNHAMDVIIKPVSAEEIYLLFTCPCCGRTIDAGCCGMAKERMLYADGLTAGKLSEEEVIKAYTKRFGLNSFKDKSLQAEYKQKLIDNAPAIRPIITMDPASYDMGDVSQKEGVASTLFTIKNEGKSDLIINKIETSCGCTSASVIYKNKEGPIFSMPGHGGDGPKNWSVAIAPQDTAQLKVYYDPYMHKDFRGTAIREIYVFSNDPIDFEAKVKIELNQVD